MRPELMAELSLRRTLLLAGRRVDVGALRVLGDGEAQRITPKALGVLLELAREPGLTRTREELLQKVWAGRAGDGDVLTQAVKELRRVFGDDLTAPRFIETVPRLGYRLLVAVEWDDAAEFNPGSDSLNTEIPPGAVAPALSRITELPPPRLPRWVLPLSLAAFLLAGLSLLVSWRNRHDGTISLQSPLMLTADPGPEYTPRISPDGSRVAFIAIDADSGRPRLQVRGMNASDTLLPTAGQGEESWPVWSADGAQLAFERKQGQRCELVTVEALGGAERVRGSCAQGMFESFDWSPDGTSFVIARFDGAGTARLQRRAVEGGDALPFDYAHDPAAHDLAPRYSPDGRFIAFRRGLSPYSDLYLVGVDGGPVRRVTQLAALIRGFDWLADGSGLVFASNHAGSQALYQVDLKDGAVRALGVAPAQMPDIATRADTLVFEVPRTRTFMTAQLLDDSAAAEVAPSTGSDSHAVLSPEGRRVAFISDRNGSQQLWLYDADSRQTFALTRDDGALFLYPQWDSTGARLLVTRRRDGGGQLLEIDLDSLAQQTVSADSADVRFGTFAPAQGYLLIEDAVDGPRLSRVAAARADAQVLRHQVAAVETDAQSGRIYYSRVGSGSVRELRGNEADDAEIAVVANRFAWHVRAGALWYLDAGAADEILLRRRDLADGGERIQWRSGEMIDHRHFDLSADAQRLLLIRSARNDTDIGVLRILRAAG